MSNTQNDTQPTEQEKEQERKRIEQELQIIALCGKAVSVSERAKDDHTTISLRVTKERLDTVRKAFSNDKMTADESFSLLIDSLITSVKASAKPIYLRGETLSQYIDLNKQFKGYKSITFIQARLNKSQLFSGLSFGISGDNSQDYKNLESIIFTVRPETIAHSVQRILNSNAVDSQINHAFKESSDTESELLELMENGNKKQRSQAEVCLASLEA